MARLPVSTTRFRRQPDSHKGDYGHLLVIGGSVGYTGAPVLCALGALRSGAGLVTVGVPESTYFIVAAQLLEAMPTPLGEAIGGCVSPAAIQKVHELAGRATAVALGPGLSQQPATQRFVRQLLPTLRLPCVVDADGLNALAGHLEILRHARAPLILTPHPGEMARLVGRRVEAVQADRLRIAHEAAARWRVVVVLKGHRTVVAAPTGRTYLNSTGHAGMATGGMGDVLTGVIGSLLGQGFAPFDAAVAGVYLHGRAGDLAARALGPVGLLATDVAAQLPAAIRPFARR